MTPSAWKVIAFILIIVIGVVGSFVGWMGLHRGDWLLMIFGGLVTVTASVAAADFAKYWP